MPRPHLEFIQSQGLPWQPMLPPTLRPGVDRRLLSRDPITGACSTVLRYPADWTGPPNQRLSCDEELFVLDGELMLDDERLGPGDYAYLPTGWCRSSQSSRDGAVVLTFFEGEPRTGSTASRHPSESGLIRRIATGEMGWGEATEPGVAGPRVGRKALRQDRLSGERTWLLSMQASETDPLSVNGVETHPCVEEMFLLAESFHMPCGVMHAGAYFWRPPGLPHGPMGAREPFLALFRAKEGAFSTAWSHRGAAVPWHAPYDPVLPPGMSSPVTSPESLERPW